MDDNKWKAHVGSVGDLFYGGDTIRILFDSDPVPFSDDYHRFTWAVGVLALIFSVIGIGMNSLVIFMAKKILFRSDRQETQHLCVLSTAVADLIFSATHCPLVFAMYSLNAYFHKSACMFLYHTTHLSTVASSLSLLCLNVDKFISLKFPLRYYSIISYRRSRIILLVIWMVAAVWATFFVFGPLTKFQDQCQMFTHEPYGLIVYLVFFSLFFLLPILVSCCISLYIFIIAKLAKKSISHASSFASSSADSDLRIQQTATSGTLRWTVQNLRTVIFVFAATNWSFCTLVPYRLLYVSFTFYELGWTEWLVLASYVLIISNPAGNPFVTCITQPQYRKLLCRYVRGRKMGSGGSSSSGLLLQTWPKRTGVGQLD